jgi:hypothetical protein
MHVFLFAAKAGKGKARRIPSVFASPISSTAKNTARAHTHELRPSAFVISTRRTQLLKLSSLGQRHTAFYTLLLV